VTAKDKRLLPLTIAIGCTGFAACIGISAYTFSRGIDFGDEGSSLYFLAHPSAPMATMDHFVWGHLAAALHLTVLPLRWLTFTLLVSSNAFLCIACLFGLESGNGCRLHRTLRWMLALSLSTLGTLLMFTVARPTINYTYTLVISANIFAACMFLRGKASPSIRIALEFVMGIMILFAFMARVPDAILLLIYFLTYLCLIERHGTFVEKLRAIAVVAGAAALALLVAIYLGYNIRGQFLFLHALTQTTHRVTDLLRADVPPGLGILAMAVSGFVLYKFAERQLHERAGQSFTVVFAGVLSVGVLGALGYMAYAGFFMAADTQSDPLYANRTLSSLTRGVHTGAIGLLLISAAPVLSTYLRSLRRWFPPEHDSETRMMLLYAAILYLLCLLPQVGTNVGIWNRSIGLGPVFLAVALVIADFTRKGQLARWFVPATLFLMTLPVVSDLYAKTINHARINGSAHDQSITLDRPAILRGLRVAPVIATLQRELEGALRDNGFDPAADVMMPATRQLGVLVLVNATSFTIGGVFEGYENVAAWNCTLIKAGLHNQPLRIFVLDFEKLDTPSKACLTGYDAGPPVRVDGAISLSVFTRRPQETARLPPFSGFERLDIAGGDGYLRPSRR
jgi:hypothetical protein